MPKETSSLKAKLKKADPDIRKHVADLKALNAKLHRSVLKMEAQAIDRDNRIKALAKQWKENRPEVHLNINTGRPNFEQMDEKMLMEKIRSFAPKLIEWGPELGLKIEPL